MLFLILIRNYDFSSVLIVANSKKFHILSIIMGDIFQEFVFTISEEMKQKICVYDF